VSANIDDNDKTLANAAIPIAVFGCWSWLLPAEAEKHGWKDLELVYKPAPEPKQQYNTDKPALYYVAASGERAAFYLLQVSPGRDFVRLYAQSLKLLLSASVDKITGGDEQAKGELLADERLMMLLQSLRGRDFKVGVFRIKSQSTARFYQFDLGLRTMADEIDGAHVLIGGGKNLDSVLDRQLNGWRVGDDERSDESSDDESGDGERLSAGPRIGGTNDSPVLWGFEVRHRSDGCKLMLLGSAITYWGELAGSLATALFEYGAESVLHVAKVGGRAPNRSSTVNLQAPRAFAIVDRRHKFAPVDIENVFADAPGALEAEVHASIATPFDETAFYVDAALVKVNPTTVDDAGAHIAKAAAKAKKAFGALYVVSDDKPLLHQVLDVGQTELADESHRLDVQSNVVRSVGNWLDTVRGRKSMIVLGVVLH
jgi:hypothetical protein